MLNPTWASRHGDSNLLYAISQPLSQLPWKWLTFSKIYLEKFFGKKKIKNFVPKFLDVIFFWQVSRYKKFLFCTGCSNHRNNIWPILFFTETILFVNWFFLPRAMCVFYRPDFSIPKWVILGQKIGLKDRTCLKNLFWTWSLNYAMLSFERIFGQKIFVIPL